MMHRPRQPTKLRGLKAGSWSKQSQLASKAGWITHLDSLERIEMTDIVKEVAEKYCPPHNAVSDEPGNEEGPFHCEECAYHIRNLFEAALREVETLTRRKTLEEAIKEVVKHGKTHRCKCSSLMRPHCSCADREDACSHVSELLRSLLEEVR